MGNPYYTWGRRIQEQEGEYFTYKRYVEACRREGVKPIGMHRFGSLMTMRGLRRAPQDGGE